MNNHNPSLRQHHPDATSALTPELIRELKRAAVGNCDYPLAAVCDMAVQSDGAGRQMARRACVSAVLNGHYGYMWPQPQWHPVLVASRAIRRHELVRRDGLPVHGPSGPRELFETAQIARLYAEQALPNPDEYDVIESDAAYAALALLVRSRMAVIEVGLTQRSALQAAEATLRQAESLATIRFIVPITVDQLARRHAGELLGQELWPKDQKAQEYYIAR